MLSSASIESNADLIREEAPALARASSWIRVQKLSRRLHQILGWFVALPALLIFATGVLLLLRQDWSWIQPPTFKGERVGLPTLSVHEAFERVKNTPESGLTPDSGWDEISSVDIRPSKGVMSFRLKSGLEVQVDGTSGAILSAAPRRTSLLIELHQGSFFHPLVMKGLFLPVGISLIGLWLSGVLLLWKRRRIYSPVSEQK